MQSDRLVRYAAAVLALLAGGCLGDSLTPGSGGGGDNCTSTVKLNPSFLTLAPGTSGSMHATVTACAQSSQIAWIVTDTSVAKAIPVNDTTATIQAVKLGTTGIVASLVAQPAVVAPGTIFVQ